jgi:hypothetical protein
MNLPVLSQRATCALAIVILGLGCSGAIAHDAGAGTPSAQALALQDGATIDLTGRLSILNVVVPMGPGSERIYALVGADGTVTRLDPGVQGVAWRDGMALALSGHVVNAALIVDQYSNNVPASALAPNGNVASSPLTVQGTVRLRHADYFDAAKSQFFWAVESDDGQRVELNFAIVPRVLKAGMRVQVSGQAASGALTPQSLTVLEFAPSIQKPATVETDKVLVILLKFSDDNSDPTQPFTQAAVVSTMTSSTGVAAYWKEASFGQEVMVPTVVTHWLIDLNDKKSTNCDFSSMATEGQALATKAGYNLSSYQKFLYVFPSNGSCGWAGLADVSGPDAWINGYNALWVMGHELGHTVGHGHDNSLVSCGSGVVIGPNCANSQYGDPWGIMGNNQPSRHVNVWQKNNLGWITDAQVATHSQGTATYTLSPLESPGGTTYGVAVFANAHRGYWLEFRQPVGFDATLTGPAIDGAVVHLANDYSGAPEIITDYNCWDTCFLTMPSSDGALAVGTAFVDNDTGVTITAISKTTGTNPTLTVSVASPTRPTFVDVPLTYWANGAIEALVWNGITKGCVSSPRQFCPTTLVTREQLAIFVERAYHGWMFSYPATGTVFADVPKTDPTAGFVESIYHDGFMTSCSTSPLDFCPTTQVTRSAMAEILLKGRYGATYVPATPTGIFADVPVSDPNAPWIEALYHAGITLGCSASPQLYCPNAIVARDQMAVFLQRAFYLAAPPP